MVVVDIDPQEHTKEGMHIDDNAFCNSYAVSSGSVSITAYFVTDSTIRIISAS